VVTFIAVVWIIAYANYVIASLITVAVLAVYLLAAYSLNKKIKNQKARIIKSLEEDSSDIIRNIFSHGDQKTEEGQFSNLITLLLEKYPRSEDVPFYFFIDSNNTSSTDVENLLKKADLVSMVDPGLNSTMEPCQCNVDHYFFDWWFTSKGVIVDLSSLFDTRDSDRLNAGLVQIESLVKFVNQFGKHSIQGMLYSVGAEILVSQNEGLLASKLDQLKLVAQAISRNTDSRLDYNLLIQEAGLIEGFDEFLSCYTEAGHFSPVGIQLANNDSHAGLIEFANSLNSFMLFSLKNNKGNLCNAQRIGDFSGSVDLLRKPIEQITNALNSPQGQQECRGVYFVNDDQLAESTIDSDTLNDQSKSIFLSAMLDNISRMSYLEPGRSKLSTAVSFSILVSGLSVLSYLFADSFTRIKSLKSIPTTQLSTSTIGFVGKVRSLIDFSVSAKLPAIVKKPSTSDSGNPGKPPERGKLNNRKLTLVGVPLQEYLLKTIYKSAHQGPSFSIVDNSSRKLDVYLQTLKKLYIPFKYTHAGYSEFKRMLETVLAQYVKMSNKVRVARGMKEIDIDSLRKALESRHINNHVTAWMETIGKIKFKNLASRQDAANLLKLLANRQEFSISIKISADHHLPSYNSDSVKKFKAYLDKIDVGFDHSSMASEIARNITHAKFDTTSVAKLRKMTQTSKNNPLQHKYLSDVENSILVLLKRTKIASADSIVNKPDQQKPGQVNTDQQNRGQGKQDQQKPGQADTDQQNTGQGKSDQGSAGQGKPDQQKPGQANSDQENSDQGAPNSNQGSNTIAKELRSEWNKSVYSYCTSRIRGRYPVNYNARSTIQIKQFRQYFNLNGRVDKFFKKRLKPYVVSTRRGYRWNQQGKDLKLGNGVLRHIEAVQTIKREWFRRGNLHLTFNLKPERLSHKAKSFELIMGGSVISYNHRGKRYQPMTWSPTRGIFARYVFINFNGDPLEGTLPRKTWFWVRWMDRTLRSRFGLVELRYDRDYVMMFHLERTRSVVRKFRLINRFRCIRL